MENNKQFNVAEFINNEKLSRFQILVIVLCGLIALLDGFDTQSIAFVAPVITQSWGLVTADFGIVFGIGLFGLMVGSLIFGPVADHIGRKKTILICLFIVGVFSILTVTADTITGLIIFRFLTGIGLGGSIPNILALTAEYTPKRMLNTSVTIMFCGFPLGAVIGGLTMSRIIPNMGWEIVFYVGGILPLLFIPIIFIYLPESIRFMVMKGASNDKIIKILKKINPLLDVNSTQQFSIAENRVEKQYIKHLFTDGLAKTTLLLWVVYFANLLIFYSLINWLPTILKSVGVPIEKAIISTAIFNLGGIVGGIIIGRLIDKRDNNKILAFTYILAALVIASIGLFLDSSVSVILFMVFLSGFFVMGSTLGVQAFMTGMYATSIRSTGVGWAIGVGRIGAIIGPLAAGLMMSLDVSLSNFFIIWAIPAVIAAIAMVFLRGRQSC